MVEARSAELSDTYRHLLVEHVVTPWFPRSIDVEHGGFFEDFDRQWRRGRRTDKLLEFQARQTLCAAELSIALPSNVELRAAVDHGFAFLTGPMWDDRFGGWYIETDRQGRPQPAEFKHVHGMTYAIAACFACHAATGSAMAMQFGNEALAWVQRNAHDETNGGYFGSLHRNGEPILAPIDPARPRDRVGTPFGCKDMDVNKDAIEMLSMAFAINGDDEMIRQAFERHVHVVLAAFGETEPPGYYFTADWEPLPGYWRPSEAVQGAALLLEVASAFPQLPVVETGWRLIQAAVRHGWNESRGGVTFEVWQGRKPPRHARKDAPWWAQVELLRAVESLRQLRPDDADVARIAEMARGAVDRTIDHTYGGIFTEPPDSVPLFDRLLGTRKWRIATAKGSMWKDASHDGRALLRVATLDRRQVRPGPPRVNIEQAA